ncbi:hypothetical protein E3N88_23074 [Mikania micrantha]|uniref:Uncharacterized protein n=1 Tax=Mikania micrantha TaxID=192012 RepID=A0A5N6NDQ0_9ASTR|nr:hypothetical protein E3N88_23074 [Mikania micrantha]
MGIDEEFSVIKTQILAMKPTPGLGAAYHLVAEDEQQRSIGAIKRPGTDAAAFQMSSYGRRSGQSTQQQNKAVQRSKHNTGKENKAKTKPRAACVELESSPIPGLTDDQYQVFLKHFREGANMSNSDPPPMANMAGKKEGEAKAAVGNPKAAGSDSEKATSGGGFGGIAATKGYMDQALLDLFQPLLPSLPLLLSRRHSHRQSHASHLPSPSASAAAASAAAVRVCSHLPPSVSTYRSRPTATPTARGHVDLPKPFADLPKPFDLPIEP